MKRVLEQARILMMRPSNGMAAYALTVVLALGLAIGIESAFGSSTAAVITAGIITLAALVLVDGWRRREAAAQESLALATSLRRDPMTGALARRFFTEEVNEALRALRNTPGNTQSATLVLIDVDHFKMLNDGHGHKAGDQALAHLVASIEAVFPQASVGRLGGDEFAVLVRGEAPWKCMARADELLAILRRPVLAAGAQIQMSVSVGIARAPEHAAFPEDLFFLADLALYESKREGRGRVTLFDEHLLKEERHRRFIERELRAAILLDHLDLHYQPVLTGDGRCHGVEALVRWNHPSLGPLSPADFIPVAENSTLIDLLGEWVLRRLCRDLPRLPGERVSFNVSGAQLRRDDVLRMVRSVVEESGVLPARLVVEITENVAVAATPEVIARIEALRAMGMRVVLDDFGTGYCGFRSLRSLPVDGVKIDRSYVSTLGLDPVSAVFLAAVAETARLLELSVLAEGVETAKELELARAAGCQLYQGYHFARPMPIERLEEWMLERAAAAPPPAVPLAV